MLEASQHFYPRHSHRVWTDVRHISRNIPRGIWRLYFWSSVFRYRVKEVSKHYSVNKRVEIWGLKKNKAFHLMASKMPYSTQGEKD